VENPKTQDPDTIGSDTIAAPLTGTCIAPDVAEMPVGRPHREPLAAWMVGTMALGSRAPRKNPAGA
jgi:hypothetical protein